MENGIFAMYDDKSIRVYQAYNNAIADEALKNGTFGNTFKMERMTWIKPSFLWMMYRSGWATKEGQNRILAIDLKKNGFNFIVRNAVLSSFSKEIYETQENWKNALKKSDIRCQWDPERDIHGNPQMQRTIQLGLKGDVVKKYVYDWIISITDITETVIDIKAAITENRFECGMLPIEVEYYF